MTITTTAVSSSITGIESRHFDTRADAPERGDLALVLPASCTPASGSPSPQPGSPEGFPEDLDVSAAVLCDTLVEVRDGERTYAWLAPDDSTRSAGTTG